MATGNGVETLILGAGPAGMTCALELSRNKKKCTVIERDSKVGGMAKTIEFVDKDNNVTFKTDIGPHRFFSKDPKLYELIEGLLGRDWTLVNRKTRQFIEGKFYDYPINAMQAFRNIGPIRGAQMFMFYFIDAFLYRFREIKNFEDYIVSKFGRKLGRFNMLNYTEKIWGIDSKKIHPDWAKQRIKGLSLISALKDAIFKKKGKNAPKTLIDQFYYPRYGTGTIYEAMKKEIEKKGSNVALKTEPTRINHDGKKIVSIELKDKNGKKKVHKMKNLVTSIPINNFLHLMHPKPPRKILEAQERLTWRGQIYLFVTLDKERVTDDNWIYFPNTEIPFGRISEMKNFSREMSPKGKTSMFIEFFVTEGDTIYNMNKDELLDLAMPFFEKYKFFTRKDIINAYTYKQPKVYPVYDLHYLENAAVAKDYLDSFENLFVIGRPGRFKYNNQDHSLEMGLGAAESIITGKKIDLDTIGAEDEYFEEGEIKTKANEKSEK